MSDTATEEPGGAQTHPPVDDPGPTADTAATSNPLDTTSVGWFDTLCTGLAPVTQLNTAAATDTAGNDLAGALTIISNSFTQTAATLQAAPSPGFTGGSTVAAQIISTLTSDGQGFAQSAAALTSADPNDPDAIAAAMGAIGDPDAVLNLDQLPIPPDTRAGIGLIPSCQALQF